MANESDADRVGANIILPNFGRIGSGASNEWPSIPIPQAATISLVYRDIIDFTYRKNLQILLAMAGTSLLLVLLFNSVY